MQEQKNKLQILKNNPLSKQQRDIRKMYYAQGEENTTLLSEIISNLRNWQKTAEIKRNTIIKRSFINHTNNAALGEPLVLLCNTLNKSTSLSNIKYTQTIYNMVTDTFLGDELKTKNMTPSEQFQNYNWEIVPLMGLLFFFFFCHHMVPQLFQNLIVKSQNQRQN